MIIRLTYYVANEDEVEIVEPFIELIQESLEKVGFEIETNCEISEFETPFSNLITENIRLSNEKVRREIEILNQNQNNPNPKKN